jgi:RNA polymerase sigma-70 factor (ECF subfamily)
MTVASLTPINADPVGLVAAAIAGDMDALHALFDQHVSQLRAKAYRLLCAPDDIDDVLHDTWLRAQRDIANRAPDLSVNAWFHRILTNLCIDRHRRAARLRFDGWEQEKHDHLLPYHDPDPIDDLLLRETRAAVRRTLERLPERDAIALRMMFDQGMGCTEVGAHLGISRSAAKSMVFRARIRFGHLFLRFEPHLCDEEMRRVLMLRAGNDIIGIGNVVARMCGEQPDGRRQARYSGSGRHPGLPADSRFSGDDDKNWADSRKEA